MTAPATPVEVVRNLTALTEELRQHTSSLRLAEQDAAVKRHIADMAESRAFLSADGAMELRKHRHASPPTRRKAKRRWLRLLCGCCGRRSARSKPASTSAGRMARLCGLS